MIAPASSSRLATRRMYDVRYALTLLHRWVGLTIAVFLIIAGLTGAVISWDHELDEVLNAHLVEAPGIGPPASPFVLKEQVEARDARRQVTYLPLAAESGHSLSMFVEGRIDPKTGLPYALGYNQVFVDPVTGVEMGQREWGAVWPIKSETFVSFLYKLHYTLHLPAAWGIAEWGTWLMGGVALLWTIDCFVGFYLTLPVNRSLQFERSAPVETRLARGFFSRWRPAWRIKASGSRFRLKFDLHRAFGLWTWVLLFVIAFTGFSLNLYRELFFPLMSMVSNVTPTPFELRTASPADRPLASKLSFERVADLATAEGSRRGWSEPVGAIGYARSFDVYRVWYHLPGDDHGTAGVGPAEIYFDGNDGRVLGDKVPWSGTAADIFMQAQFPVHSGRILGLPGRIIISVMGLIVAIVSVTGILIWLRKSRARRSRSHRRSEQRAPISVPAE